MEIEWSFAVLTPRHARLERPGEVARIAGQ